MRLRDGMIGKVTSQDSRWANHYISVEQYTNMGHWLAYHRDPAVSLDAAIAGGGVGDILFVSEDELITWAREDAKVEWLNETEAEPVREQFFSYEEPESMPLARRLQDWLKRRRTKP